MKAGLSSFVAGCLVYSSQQILADTYLQESRGNPPVQESRSPDVPKVNYLVYPFIAPRRKLSLRDFEEEGLPSKPKEGKVNVKEIDFARGRMSFG
jgi:hypothetical protein